MNKVHTLRLYLFTNKVQFLIMYFYTWHLYFLNLAFVLFKGRLTWRLYFYTWRLYFFKVWKLYVAWLVEGRKIFKSFLKAKKGVCCKKQPYGTRFARDILTSLRSVVGAVFFGYCYRGFQKQKRLMALASLVAFLKAKAILLRS